MSKKTEEFGVICFLFLLLLLIYKTCFDKQNCRLLNVIGEAVTYRYILFHASF